MTYDEAAAKYLTPPEYERFVRNVRDNHRLYGGRRIRLNHECDPECFVDHAFCWEDTPEGHDYWEEIHERMGE